MGLHDAVAWTAEMDALIGTTSDAQVGAKLGLPEGVVRYRRRKLARPPFRTSRGRVTVPCAACGRMHSRTRQSFERAKVPTCSATCAATAMKRRDTESLRYGPGWKALREQVRTRDQRCRACGTAPVRTALHVHHIKPARIGGPTTLANLVALCESCHHRIEAATQAALDAIPIDVSLDGFTVTVTLNGQAWRRSAPGADCPTSAG